MRRTGVVAALWAAFAFAAWNVSFDRQVTTAALQFSRQQIIRYQQGETPASLHDGFTRRVHDAALRASLITVPIVLVGTAAVYLTLRRKS